MLSVRDQCQQAQVPFFFKQWGGFNTKAAGRVLDGRNYDEMPPRVQNPMPNKKGRVAMIGKASVTV